MINLWLCLSLINVIVITISVVRPPWISAFISLCNAVFLIPSLLLAATTWLFDLGYWGQLLLIIPAVVGGWIILGYFFLAYYSVKIR